ncbi:hypothetical protein CDD83_6404 [Cordyceps sp. RAO-2017]|nr:hypothetical protein CDD83_6404 [Cordyceps sp. RAO-2017]
MPVSEVCVIPVSGDVENWKNQLKLLLQPLKNQSGYLRTRWGPCSEDMQRLVLMIGWESVEASENWKASPECAQVMGQLKTVQSGEIHRYYIQFVPYAPKEVIDASVVEVLTYAGCKVAEDEMRSAVEGAKALPGCTGVASAYSLDGQSFVAVVGWEGADKSEAADKSLYATSKGATPETYHVNFRFPIKGFGGL